VSDGTATSTCSTTATVQDTTPPVINRVSASPAVLWPPNHAMIPVTITADATDLCSPTVCQVVSVTSNEPANGRGDGNTTSDFQLTGPLAASLRAERAGGGSGRLYTLTVQCADAAGNSATEPVTVTVTVTP
jgi:hypothetical protein